MNISVVIVGSPGISGIESPMAKHGASNSKAHFARMAVPFAMVRMKGGYIPRLCSVGSSELLLLGFDIAHLR